MKIIAPISNNILKNWHKQRFSEKERYRPLVYLKELTVNEGMLLYNCMTNELIFITKEEYEKFMNNTLKEDNFFLYHRVPNICRMLRQILLFLNPFDMYPFQAKNRWLR